MAMLSNTGGYSRHSHVLGFRKDAATLQCALCPALRAKGRCKAYQLETRLRAELAAQKERELRTTAMQLYSLQEEILQRGREQGVDTSEDDKQAVVEKIVGELKKEQSYVRWNLDVEVVERMTLLRTRPCRYSHQRDLLTVLKPRKGTAKLGSKHMEKAQGELGAAASGGAENRLSEEHRRIFEGLSPLQKCVVCLLWQRTFEIPQKVVCDVRRQVEVERGYDSDDQEDAAVVDAAIEEEERRVVTVTTCRLSIGSVDLSSLPSVAAYIARHPNEPIIRTETWEHFTVWDAKSKSRRSALLPSSLTEKQVDLSTAACAHEVMGAVVWALRTMDEERRLQSDPNERRQERSRQQRHTQGKSAAVVLRTLTLRRCSITAADALVAALRKYKLDTTLLALDVSDNRLMCLRFLFALRAHFAERLLRLSLANNPITRKPDYREQVRKSLPKLTSLDGVAIRRPPLRFPHPSLLSYTLAGGAATASATSTTVRPKEHSTMSDTELEQVMDAVSRFFYIWETRRVPWTAAELRHIRDQGGTRCRGRNKVSKRRRGEGTGLAITSLEDGEEEPCVPPEEDLDDDNFHHRYLHPYATFSLSVHEGLSFFASDIMRVDAEVEMDKNYTGMRLSSLDASELRVFDVSMKNSSRNLLLGRSVLHRHARGSLSCYTAYKCTLYPPSLSVCHHFPAAVVSASKIICAAVNAEPRKQQRQERQNSHRKQSKGDTGNAHESKTGATVFFPNRTRKPTFYTVTIHGLMTWRAPSMKRCECVRAAYDRVMTLVENTVYGEDTVEGRRSAPLLIFNDQLHLRPAGRCDDATTVCHVTPTLEYVTRLVVEFGLEACVDGARLVRAVAERSTSDASTHAALTVLVFGSVESCESKGEEVGSPNVSASGAVHSTAVDHDDPTNGVEQTLPHFDIYSVLTSENSTVADNGCAVVECPPHRVTLADVDAAVAASNSRYTFSFSVEKEELGGT